MDAPASQTLLQRELAKMKMKLTESDIKEIIDEEIQAMIDSGEIDEGMYDRFKARASSMGTKLKGAGRGMVQKGLGAVAGVAGEDEMAQKMKDKAAATKAGTADKALAKKTLSILNSHLKAMEEDIEKLGIDPNTPGVKGAISMLKRALAGSISSRAGA